MAHGIIVGRISAGILPPHITENVLELVYFEDLPLGGEWVTRRRTVTEADLTAFVGLSGDFNPLYTDVEHARAGHYGERVLPGALIAAMATGLGSMDVPTPATVGLVGMSWSFHRAVRPGDTIRSLWRLNRKRPVENPRWGLVAWQIEVENQRSEIVASAEVVRLVGRRELPVAEAARQGKSRRRRRRGPVEAPPVLEVTPKPTPGPLREPLPGPTAEPPLPQPRHEPEPVRAEPLAGEPAAAESPAETPSQGRRRRRSGAKARQEAATAVEPAAEATVEAPPAPEPEPAPVTEAAPAPTTPRRRRRRGPSQAAPVLPEIAEPAQAPEPQAAPESEPEAPPAPRRRRRRTTTPQPELALDQTEAPAPEPVETPAPAPEPPPPPPEPWQPPQAPLDRPSPFLPPARPVEPEPEPKSEPEAPTDEDVPEGSASSGIAGIFRRLRGD
jgi:acyl dehydratase